MASALCAVAPSLGVLVACRVLQGVGAAMLQANSVAIIALAVPRERLARAIGIQGAAQALGLAAGPTLGGLLLAVGGWRLLFVVNVPTGLVAIVLGILFIPRSTELRSRVRLDLVGLATMIASVAAGLCAITLTGSGGLGLGWTAAFAAVAVACGAVFATHERRSDAPLVDLALGAAPAIGLGVLGTMAAFAVLFGTLLAVPFYLERGLHVGVVVSGVLLAVMPAAMGASAVLSGRTRRRRGPVPPTVTGMVVCVAALGSMAVCHGDVTVLAVELASLGIGLGIFTPTNNAAIVAAAPRCDAGVVGGLLNMCRGLGTAVGLAVTSLALGGGVRSSSAGEVAGGFTTAMVVLVGVGVAGLVAARRAARGEHPARCP